jgi:predicted transcriptional regulator
MIKEILTLFTKGNLTINEIALELDISKSELINRIMIIEKMGYIKTSKEQNKTIEKGNLCTFCVEAKQCSQQKTSGYDKQVYQITEKGKRLIR